MQVDVTVWCKCVHTTKSSLTPNPVVGPFDYIEVDLIKFPKSKKEDHCAIVFVNYLKKWPEVFATKTKAP